MEVYAISACNKLPIKKPGAHFATLISAQFPVEIRHPVFKPFWISFQNVIVNHYEIEFVPVRKRKNQIFLESPAWGAVATRFWQTLFVFFYELA
ncbi:MAG TPA: hypothetical protein QF900_08285 [Arenicellales bacterium]|jgi:hypothetical protein|nr:hypothetical protein [Arenicellales bacterium]